MDFSFSSLMAGFVFGVLGVYFIKQGKKEANIPVFFVGVVLVGYPYFIESTFWLWGIGVGLVFVAYRLLYS